MANLLHGRSKVGGGGRGDALVSALSLAGLQAPGHWQSSILVEGRWAQAGKDDQKLTLDIQVEATRSS